MCSISAESLMEEDLIPSCPGSPCLSFQSFSGLSSLDGELAAEIDQFASLLSSFHLPPSLMKKLDQLYPIKPSPLQVTASNQLFNFDDLQLDSLYDTAWSVPVKVEKPLPLVTSSSASLNQKNATKINLKVPSLPQEEIPMLTETTYFPVPVPNEPGLFIASQVRPKARVVKRKRTAVADEECPTDGTLFNLLMDEYKNQKVPCLGSPHGTRKAECRKNRLATKLKLEMKRREKKNFKTHYPERKAVACARKRVGGRFVKEQKSVFRPVKQSTMTV